MNMRDHSKFKAVLRMIQISNIISMYGMYNISDFDYMPNLELVISNHHTLLEISTENILLDNWSFRVARKKQKALPYLFKRQNITL